MIIQSIKVKKRINGDEFTELFEDDREIKTASELEKYRDSIEDCFKKKYKAEDPDGTFTIEVLFVLKNN